MISLLAQPEPVIEPPVRTLAANDLRQLREQLSSESLARARRAPLVGAPGQPRLPVFTHGHAQAWPDDAPFLEEGADGRLWPAAWWPVPLRFVLTTPVGRQNGRPSPIVTDGVSVSRRAAPTQALADDAPAVDGHMPLIAGGFEMTALEAAVHVGSPGAVAARYEGWEGATTCERGTRRPTRPTQTNTCAPLRSCARARMRACAGVGGRAICRKTCAGSCWSCWCRSQTTV